MQSEKNGKEENKNVGIGKGGKEYREILEKRNVGNCQKENIHDSPNYHHLISNFIENTS